MQSVCIKNSTLRSHSIRKGVAMNPDKVFAIQQMKPPKNDKDVQRFLRMSGYYRKYILDYA